MLTLLYGGGLRVSELCGLRWRDLAPRDAAGQATVFGKGGKTRAVLLSANTWRILQALRGEAGPMHPCSCPARAATSTGVGVHRIVKTAAARAGLSEDVSAHWLRHAHASHSLDRGAPIHLVQATLGHASVATTGRYLHARPTDSSARYLGGLKAPGRSEDLYTTCSWPTYALKRVSPPRASTRAGSRSDVSLAATHPTTSEAPGRLCARSPTLSRAARAWRDVPRACSEVPAA